MDALQEEVKIWYAAAKERKKTNLATRLRATFQGEKYTTLTNYQPTGTNKASKGAVEGDVKRIIQDLHFDAIPVGKYEESIQSLLAMVLTQDAKIKILEQKLERLLDKQ